LLLLSNVISLTGTAAALPALMRFTIRKELLKITIKTLAIYPLPAAAAAAKACPPN